MSSITGDFGKLAKLVQALKKVTPEAAEIAKRTAVKFAPDLRDLIYREFVTGTDPFGDPWKPLKAVTLKKGRTPPPMTATGATRDSLLTVPLGPSDRASLAGFLKYHLQSRPVLPLRGEKWPEPWLATIRARAAQATNDILKAVGR